MYTTDVAEHVVHTYPTVLTLGWTLTDDSDPAHARTDDRIAMGPSQPDVTFLFNVIDLSNPNRETAEQLGIAEKTVRLHVSSVLNKMGVRDRTQATIYALQRGLVHLD